MAMVYWKKGRKARAPVEIVEQVDGVDVKRVINPGKVHRSKWVAVVAADESADGQEHWITIPVPADTKTVKGEQAARAWLQAHLTGQFKMKAAGVVPTPSRTMKELCDAYLENRGKSKKDCREKHIISMFLGHKAMAAKEAKTVTKDDIQSYLNERRPKERKLKDGRVRPASESLGTYKRHRACLITVFNEAKVHPNPAAETFITKYNDKRLRFLSSEEQARMEPFFHDPVHLPGLYRLGRIITFALFSLMRKQEILHCRWRDIDLTEHRDVDGSLQPGEITVTCDEDHQTKDKDPRKVDLWPELKSLLLTMRAEAMKAADTLFPAVIQDRYVFLSADGTPYKDIKTVWNTLLKKAGITRLHFHDLRRTGAMRYYTLGVEPRVLQTMLGHSSLEVTERYLGIATKEQTPSMNRAWARKQEQVHQAAVATVAKAN